jgi:hypothetical protein
LRTIAHGVMSLRSRFLSVSVFGCSCFCGRSSLSIDCSCCCISLSVLPIGACVFGSSNCACCLVGGRLLDGHGANGGFV